MPDANVIVDDDMRFVLAMEDGAAPLIAGDVGWHIDHLDIYARIGRFVFGDDRIHHLGRIGIILRRFVGVIAADDGEGGDLILSLPGK